MAATRKTIVVTGDPMCDHNYYRGNRATADSSDTPGFREFHSGGGAFLLKALIETTLSSENNWQVLAGLPQNHELLPQQLHSFCLWEQHPESPSQAGVNKQPKVWRASEPLLGYGHVPQEKHDDIIISAELSRKPNKGEDCHILVIDDAGLGFKDASFDQYWPLDNNSNVKAGIDWIVMKLTGTIMGGSLWKQILADYRENLILIVSADQLRRNNIRISRGLSWESTIEDLVNELNNNPELSALRNARHLIINFHSDGAFWLNNDDSASFSTLVFDATCAEGEWAEQQGPGTVFGYMSCITASIVNTLCLDKVGKKIEEPDLESALCAGLGACRDLCKGGYGPVTIKKIIDKKEQEIVNDKPGFPLDAIADKIRNPSYRYVGAVVPKTLTERSNWSMLDEWQVHSKTSISPRPHFEAAMALAVLGPGALERFPIAKFGGLQTIDRTEIESLRSIRYLMRSYMEGSQKKPLSIGVFGPPGAGKSFGVIELAKSALRLKDENILTFNLSQFDEPTDLIGAYHRIRDKVLTGETPLIFWDEFDSQDYRWLQYLLAPMQDGAFQDGQMTHPIGKSIFVFAGATSPTFEAFGPIKPNHDQSSQEDDGVKSHLSELRRLWQDFMLKKGPDFKSRLVGYLNVLGPNIRLKHVEKNGQWEESYDLTDLCYPIRRALFIRAQFKLKESERLVMDMGVLKALLETPKYKSGARSLEFFCGHLREMAAGQIPRRSHLPGMHLMEMHVDSKTFWNICERDMHFHEVAEKLAPILHNNYVKNLPPEKRKDNSNAVPWSQLVPEMQKSNFEQALRIPSIVAHAGLKVIRGSYTSKEDEDQIQSILSEHLEVMAEAEHNGWMIERMLAGWRFAKKTKDDIKKHHPLLIPYAQLPEKEKNKDRYVILGNEAEATPGYVEKLKEVGWRIEKG